MKRPKIRPTDRVTRSPYGADDLAFCDEDIQEAFRDTTAFIGIASIVQLTREIRKLREAICARPDNKADTTDAMDMAAGGSGNVT